MCDYTNEPNLIQTFMALRIIQLEEELEEFKLLLIEANNPGINMDLVRESRNKRVW